MTTPAAADHRRRRFELFTKKEKKEIRINQRSLVVFLRSLFLYDEHQTKNQNVMPDSLASNPFITRRIRPGAIPFIFPQPQSIDSLLASLSQNKNWGQIIGPHGSGKSTLLATLLPELASRGTEPIVFSLHDGQRRLSGEMKTMIDAAPPRAIVVVDGYEQLAFWSRHVLKKKCRRQSLGLLVTTHQTVGLATLWQMRPDVKRLQAVVDRLTTDFPGVISNDDVEQSFEAHGDNIREMLFSLFDLFEQRSV